MQLFKVHFGLHFFLHFFCIFNSKIDQKCKKMPKKCEKNATELLGLHLRFSKNAISKSICNFGKSHFSKNAISIFRTTFVKTHFLENAKCNDHRNLYFFLARILDEAPARPQCNQSLGKVWGLKFPGPGPSPSPSPNLPVFLRLKATAYRPLTLAVAYLKLRIDLPHIVFFLAPPVVSYKGWQAVAHDLWLQSVL